MLALHDACLLTATLPAQPAGSRNASRLRQCNKVQGGAASLSCFIISDAAIAAPCSTKSCSRSPQRMNRHRGRSQPEKRRTSFRAVEPTILPCISSWRGS